MDVYLEDGTKRIFLSIKYDCKGGASRLEILKFAREKYSNGETTWTESENIRYFYEFFQKHERDFLQTTS